jgi:hypothetical protein
MTRLDQIMVKMGFDVSESSKVTDAMNKVNNDAKKAGEGMEGFNVKGREGHELIRKIAGQSPIMGAALKAALSPESAGIVALIVAFEWLHKQIEKVEDKVKELIQDGRELWYTERENAIKAQEGYEDYESKVAEAMDSKKHKLEDETKEYERQLALIKELADAHGKVVGAVQEAADADLKRKRTREDRAFKGTPEEKRAIDDKREYEDAALKRAREKQADADAATGERATQTLMTKRLAALAAERDKAKQDGEAFAKEEEKHQKERYVQEAHQTKALADLKKEIAENDLTVSNAEGGSFWGNAGRGALGALAKVPGFSALGVSDTAKKAQALLAATDAEAKKKQADLETEYQTLLKNREKVQKEIEASTKKQGENAADVIAKEKALTDLKQKQADLNQQIAQNQVTRQRVGNIREQELAQLKSDLNPGGPMTKSEMLASVLANDSMLQQAKQGVAGAKSAAERRYWQQIADSQTEFDRQRFSGVLTPEELRAGSTKPGETDPNTEFLKDIRDILAGDK